MKTRKLCNDPPLKNSVQYAKNYEYCVYQDGIDILLTLESNLNYYIMVEDSTNTHDHSPPTYEPSFFHVKKIHRMLYNLYRNGNNYIGEFFHTSGHYTFSLNVGLYGHILINRRWCYNF